MKFVYSRSAKSLALQAQGVRRLHVLGGMAFGFLALSLVISTIFGSFLFSEKTESKASTKEVFSFNNVSENSPIPLLLSHSHASTVRVEVKGETITKNTESASEAFTPATTLSNNHIRAFAFETSVNEFGIAISLSWNVKKGNRPSLYVVSETDSGRVSQNDIDIYSINGKNLERATRGVQVDRLQKYLYLKVFQLNESGEYELVDTSPVISVSN